jgi:hypothetical protein
MFFSFVDNGWFCFGPIYMVLMEGGIISGR